MQQDEITNIMAYRVKKLGNEHYKAMDMTPDQAAERRANMRRNLRNTQWANVSNEVIDNMRLWTQGNGGIYVEDAGLYQYYIPDRAVSFQQASFRRERSMIPFEYLNMMSGDFKWNIYGNQDTAESRNMIKQFIMNFERFRDRGMGLYIYSATKGSGKTMLASIVLNEISKRYAVSVKFIPVLELIEMTKKSFNGEENEIRSLYDAGVLVLDDLGVQMKKEWIETVLYRLIDHRYRHKLITIYTSNKKYMDMGIDDRITDRIDATSHLLALPEVPIRHRKKQSEKEEFINGLLKTGPQEVGASQRPERPEPLPTRAN